MKESDLLYWIDVIKKHNPENLAPPEFCQFRSGRYITGSRLEIHFRDVIVADWIFSSTLALDTAAKHLDEILPPEFLFRQSVRSISMRVGNGIPGIDYGNGSIKARFPGYVPRKAYQYR